MYSGSLDSTIKQYEMAHNYYIFRQSILDVLEDAGYNTKKYNPTDVDSVTFLLLRNLLGEEKLKEYISELMPPRKDLN